ncbi:mitochondrial SDR family oxidoreductase [Andalucia godoyi]|uniref:Mitochondrial SDR family oxidoreductase n=1 Tax=Andalucia godoyi TaxID=505711 RepID=A0A8K0AIY3_ANDGO|nr:mitochondrial SDR family oxidoreductase [Andalucia godoyi]|eukprot:ANDGO_07363.mRNA.1 mitochondrial SDR family oxidoreductase
MSRGFSVFVLGASSCTAKSLYPLLLKKSHLHPLTLSLVARDAKELENAELFIRQLDPSVRVIKSVAAANEDGAIGEAVQRTVTEFGSVDASVNLIGSILLKPAHLTSIEDFRTVWETNVQSSFSMLRHVTKHMMRQPQGGSVVLMSSAVSRHGFANHEAVSAAKGAINSLTLSAASSYAKHKIRVNAVLPGLTFAKMSERLTSNSQALQASIAMHALGKIGTTEDVARSVSFFLDPVESGHVTGQLLAVDGGLGSVKAS